jgi:hypothetical protein
MMQDMGIFVKFFANTVPPVGPNNRIIKFAYIFVNGSTYFK